MSKSEPSRCQCKAPHKMADSNARRMRKRQIHPTLVDKGLPEHSPGGRGGPMTDGDAPMGAGEALHDDAGDIPDMAWV